MATWISDRNYLFWESNQTIAYSSTDWGDQFITNVSLGDAQHDDRTSFGLYDKLVGNGNLKFLPTYRSRRKTNSLLKSPEI